MPTLTQTDQAKGIAPSAYPHYAGECVAIRATVTVPANAALADIFEMVTVPAGFVVRDMILDSDDLDSNGSPALLFDVGWMSGAAGNNDNTRTVGNEFFAADATGKAGGVARPTLKTAFRQPKNADHRSIGMKINAAAGTGAAGTFGLTVFVSAD